mmetsp:Transcript_6958/g.25632  ORF Transcript_6958/g.25632 Transcript_6958/m.25632 type:complete len:82 (+) Transcript_6958:786-1031(+)
MWTILLSSPEVWQLAIPPWPSDFVLPERHARVAAGTGHKRKVQLRPFSSLSWASPSVHNQPSPVGLYAARHLLQRKELQPN